MRFAWAALVVAACGGQIDPSSVSSAQQAAPGDDSSQSSSSGGASSCASVRPMTTIATAMGGLAVDDTDVWVLEEDTGRILRYPKCGGDAVEVYDGKTLQSPGGGVLRVDADFVYWSSTAAYGGTIVRMPKTGGQPQPIVEGVYAPRDFVLDDANVYWVDNAYPSSTGPPSGNVAFVPKTGGQRTTLAANEPTPSSIVVVGDTVYWANARFKEADAAIKRIPKTGGAQETLAQNVGFVAGLAVSSTSIAWIELPFDSGAPVLVHTIPIDGGTVTDVAADTNIGVGIVSDGDSFFWGTSEPGKVEVIALAPDGTSTIVGSDAVPGGAYADGAFYLALDATRVWSLAWAYIDNPSGAPQSLLSNAAR